MNKSTEVGIYPLGYDNVRLFLVKGQAGRFEINPFKELPKITIGGDYVAWSDIYGVLLHEVMEFSLTREGYRYVNTQDMSCSSDATCFMLWHSQFSDCCAKSAEFLAECYKDFKMAWIKYKIEHKIGRPKYISVGEPNDISNNIPDVASKD